MNRIHRASILFGVLVILNGLTLACSHSDQNQSVQKVRLNTSQINSSLTDPKSTAFLKQGAAKAMKQDYKGAISDYNQSLKLNANNPDAYYNRGVAQYAQGLLEPALKDFNQAIQLDPKFAEAYGNRGELYWQQGDKQEAVRDFQQAAKLFAQQGDKASAAQMNKLISQL